MDEAVEGRIEHARGRRSDPAIEVRDEHVRILGHVGLFAAYISRPGKLSCEIDEGTASAHQL
jgi:hypothetical protein